jgi:AcrR family transcriptional regulator
MPDVKPLTRKERAVATRRRIVDSAHRLFVGQGYAETTMPAVADDAGVAVQTIYFTFRTKGDLLHAVYEKVVLGPDGIPPHRRPWWPTIDDGYSMEHSVRRFIEGTIELLARAAPLVWTVLGDETARAGYDHHEQLRRYGYTELMTVLTTKHPLRSGITQQRARDVLLVLTGPQLYVQYIRDLHWTDDELADWLTAAVLEQVFGVTEPSKPEP